MALIGKRVMKLMPNVRAKCCPELWGPGGGIHKSCDRDNENYLGKIMKNVKFTGKQNPKTSRECGRFKIGERTA